MSEIWLPVCGYEEYYEVSNSGKIRRISPANATVIGRLLNPSTDRYGYFVVHLSGGGKHTYKKVHLAVIEAFVGPRPPQMETNHKNGNKQDNRWPENLEYVTSDDNHNHARNTGLLARGEDNGQAKLSDEVVKVIFNGNERPSVLAKRYSITRRVVWLIRTGKAWNHITHLPKTLYEEPSQTTAANNAPPPV
jgi:hypothetical protein